MHWLTLDLCLILEGGRTAVQASAAAANKSGLRPDTFKCKKLRLLPWLNQTAVIEVLCPCGRRKQT